MSDITAIRAAYVQGYEAVYTEGESFFSWTPCPCCRSELGGNRYELRGLIKDEKSGVRMSEHIGNVCADCMEYFEG